MEEDEDLQDSESKCSVCALPLENETSERRSSRRERSRSPPPLSILQKQLETVFFMRNVIELPVKRLVRLLKTKGDPENWIKFCSSCTIKIENVRKLFTELQTISRKYEEAKSEILVMIRSLKGNVSPGIPTECRNWVLRNSLDEPKLLKTISNASFVEGDKEALKLALILKPRRRATSTSQDHRGSELVDAGSSTFTSEDFGEDDGPTTPIGVQDNETISDDDGGGAKSGLDDQLSDSNESGASTPEPDSGDEWQPEIPKKKKKKPDPDETVYVPKRLRQDEGTVYLKRYSCSLCPDKKKLNICKFTEHIYKVHQSQYKCSICPRGFPLWDDYRMQSHWGTYHKEEMKEVLFEHRIVKVDALLPDISWPCPACPPDTAFASEDLRDAHLMTCDDGRNAEKPFTCEACTKTYVNEEELELHIVIVHPGMFKETQFRCDICLDFFSTERKYRTHKIRTHGAEKFMCDICGKNFSNKHGLESHLREWHDEEKGLEKVTCKVCQKTLASSKSLRFHMRMVHQQQKGETCGVCGEKKVHLTYHLRLTHGIRAGTRLKYYYCVFKNCNCGKAFPDLESIKEHIELKKVEASLVPKPPVEKKYVCDLCGVRRLTSYAADLHKATVHRIGVEKFSCKDCGKFLGKSFRLNTHVCGVEVQKSHICDLCGYATAHKASLNFHVRSVHEKNFKFLCELCSFGTNSRTALANHKASVHGIGDYPCKMEGCTRVYGNQEQMEQHYRSVHEGIKIPKTHVCSFCEASFRRGDNLKRHVLSHHANTSNREKMEMEDLPHAIEIFSATFSKASPESSEHL